MKKLIWILLLSLMMTVGGVLIFYTQFNLFPSEEIFINSFTDTYQNHYRVVHIPSNATTENVVQIRRLKASNDYDLVRVLKGYTKFTLLNEVDSDTLKFVVWDDQKVEKKDTLMIKLNH